VPYGKRFALIEHVRHRLGNADAVPQLAILGVLAGLSTGLVMLIFRAIVQLPLMAFLPGHDSENFEGLAVPLRVGLVVGGSLLLGLWLDRVKKRHLSVGVVHVMERLSRHQGRLPLRNAIVQFIGGAAALLTGQSGGREGPAIHLGAAASSLLGQFFRLPNNSARTLVACGTAAAIAGSFNTPLAGVIFAMEVVMMEYTITSFVPVILAAVTSTLLSQAVFGNHTAFAVPSDMQVHSLAEYPIILLEGLLVGCVASAFLATTKLLARAPVEGAWARIAIAGAATGAACIVVPEVMGIGYDTVELALQGRIALGTLAGVLVAKLLVSAVTYALRVPVGVIGPTLVIGACVGALLGMSSRILAPGLTSDASIYVILGMGAMMGAVLQAPLAALIAVVELTDTPNITLPAMLAIIVATITASSLFRQRSVFLTALEARGFSYAVDPVAQYLQRAGVSGVMERSFASLSEQVTRSTAAAALDAHPRWIVVEGPRGPLYLMNAADLRSHLENVEAQQRDGDASISLKEIAGVRMDVASIDFRATMYEAWELLKDTKAEALCVRRVTGPKVAPTLGVLTRQDVLHYAQFKG